MHAPMRSVAVEKDTASGERACSSGYHTENMLAAGGAVGVLAAVAPPRSRDASSEMRWNLNYVALNLVHVLHIRPGIAVLESRWCPLPSFGLLRS